MFFAIVDNAAHEGHITETDPDRDGFRFADITGSHGTVLTESVDRVVVDTALAEWLVCPEADAGRYCYTHNPNGGH